MNLCLRFLSAVIFTISVPVLWADVRQAEENPTTEPETDLVITNTAQLGDLFLQGYNYPVGTWVWTPNTFEPMTVVWANGLPSELAGLTNYPTTQLHGVPAWPLWITLYPLDGADGEITVLQPWSETELTRFAVPDGFSSWQVYQNALYPSCILSGINYTNWDILIDQRYSQFATPQVTMHAWLMDFANQDTYWSNYMAEEAEAEALSMADQRPSFMLQTMEEGEESDLSLSGTCGITNLTQPFFITGIQQDTNRYTTITWQSCPMFHYIVLSTDELSTNTAWLTQAYVWGQANITSWTDTTTTNVAQRFYKVRRILGSPIATGGYYSLALRPDGTLWAWGHNDGEFGDGLDSSGVEESRPFPVEMAPVVSCVGQFITNAMSLAAGGDDFTVVVDANGTVWTCGENTDGQLGNGSEPDSALHPVPTPISGVSNVVSVAAGDFFALALRADGRVFAWGYDLDNSFGSPGVLGAGTLPFSDCDCTNSPIQPLVSTQSVIVAIAAGDDFSLAVDTTGMVWGWGNNAAGQLGTNAGGSTNLPTLVQGISNVIAIAAGYNHTIAITADRTVWTWGGNSIGQLGRDNTGGMIATPGQVPNLSNVVAIAGGAQFSLAVTSNGQVYAWGDNSAGQLGTNADAVTFTNRPMLVAGISNVVVVSAPRTDDRNPPGGLHSMAMSMDQGTNRYWGWGDNLWGEVGNGISGDGANLTNQDAPALVQFCTRCQRNVQLGTSGSFTAECNGTLYLYFNDDQTAFGDNAGSYTVSFDGLSTNVNVLANNVNGVAVGILTNGGVYTYSASGICYSCNVDTNCWTDADGKHDGGFATCSSLNATNAVYPAGYCFSLVGKIQ